METYKLGDTVLLHHIYYDKVKKLYISEKTKCFVLSSSQYGTNSVDYILSISKIHSYYEYSVNSTRMVLIEKALQWI